MSTIIEQCRQELAVYGIDFSLYHHPRLERVHGNEFTVYWWLKSDDHRGLQVFGKSYQGEVVSYQMRII